MATTGTSSTNNSNPNVFDAINAASKSKSTSNSSAMSATSDRFLTLLTTQLKNQDPLNPTDNAQLTSQLAQINTVEGIEKLNTALTQLLSAYSDSQSMQSASLIGKTVLVPGNELVATKSGGWVGGALLSGDADNVKLEIRDEKGNLVQTKNLGAKEAGSFVFSWDGKDSDGKAVDANGTYTFKVTATQGDHTVNATALKPGTVSALVKTAGGFQLDIGDTDTYKFSDVQQIL